MSIRPGDQVTGKRPGSINVRHPELQSLFRMEMASATKVIMNQANQLTRRRTRGIVWVPLDSGHIGSFDRRKCKGPLSGPGAEKGEKCPERVELLSITRPSASRRFRSRRESVLRLGRPARHPRFRREHANRDRKLIRFAACPS
jgi:hypothetical protein